MLFNNTGGKKFRKYHRNENALMSDSLDPLNS